MTGFLTVTVGTVPFTQFNQPLINGFRSRAKRGSSEIPLPDKNLEKWKQTWMTKPKMTPNAMTWLMPAYVTPREGLSLWYDLLWFFALISMPHQLTWLMVADSSGPSAKLFEIFGFRFGRYNDWRAAYHYCYWFRVSGGSNRLVGVDFQEIWTGLIWWEC